MEKPEMMQENLTRPWHERIDPVTKLLLIAVLTLLSFVLTNIFAEAALILATIFLLLFSGKLGSSMKALGFCAFMILTMLLIQGLFLPSQRDDCFFFRRNCVLPGRFDVCRFAWVSNHRDRSCNEFFHADDDDF